MERFLCAPVSLVFRVVEVRVRTPVQAAVLQLSAAPVDPAGPHSVVGYVYALEKGAVHCLPWCI